MLRQDNVCMHCSSITMENSSTRESSSRVTQASPASQSCSTQSNTPLPFTCWALAHRVYDKYHWHVPHLWPRPFHPDRERVKPQCTASPLALPFASAALENTCRKRHQLFRSQRSHLLPPSVMPGRKKMRYLQLPSAKHAAGRRVASTFADRSLALPFSETWKGKALIHCEAVNPRNGCLHGTRTKHWLVHASRVNQEGFGGAQLKAVIINSDHLNVFIPGRAVVCVSKMMLNSATEYTQKAQMQNSPRAGKRDQISYLWREIPTTVHVTLCRKVIFIYEKSLWIRHRLTPENHDSRTPSH